MPFAKAPGTASQHIMHIVADNVSFWSFLIYFTENLSHLEPPERVKL